MLQEDEARRLLELAGRTVPDAEPRALPRPPAPRRGLMVALVAATVAALVGTTWVVLHDRGHRPDSAPAPSDGVTPGHVPSVFGYPRDGAVALLERHGYRVQLRDTPGCDVGRPMKTAPTPGSALAPGGTVTLFIAATFANTDCRYGEAVLGAAWKFVDFANGRGPAPAFTGSVRVFVDGRQTALLQHPEDRDSWVTPSPLSVVRDGTRRVVAEQLRSGIRPAMAVRVMAPPGVDCHGTRPPGVGRREAMVVEITQMVDGQFRCPANVALYSTDGRIDTVVAWSDKAAASKPTLPDVRGMPLAQAREAVGRAGFGVHVEQRPSCFPRTGTVTEQAPTPQDLVDDGDDSLFDARPVVVLTTDVLDPDRDCRSLKRLARALVAFADGDGPPPELAPQVRLLVGYEQAGTLSAGKAADRTAWGVCVPYAGRDCPLSPLATVGGHDVAYSDEAPVGDTPEMLNCLQDRGALPADLGGYVVIHPATAPETCPGDWQVWVWVDDEGRLSAVNLLLGPP